LLGRGGSYSFMNPKDKKLIESTKHLANDLIQLTESLYHQRKYTEAIEVGRIALKERPRNVKVRSWLIKAFVQEEQWQEAKNHIESLRSIAPLRDVYYLEGFYERKHGNFEKAIDAYQSAKSYGWQGVAVSRELAQCYLMLNNLEQAEQYIKEAVNLQRDNRYILDLWVQIASKKGDEEAAYDALNNLKVIDKPIFYHHRYSRVLLQFKHTEAALDHARKAVSFEDRPPFEVLAHLIDCEIENDQLLEAENNLIRLNNDYGHRRNDVRIGLRCKLAIAQGNYRDALDESNRIEDKDSYFYKRIRRDALSGELQQSALPDNVRTMYEEELSGIENEKSVDIYGGFTLLDIDDVS